MWLVAEHITCDIGQTLHGFAANFLHAYKVQSFKVISIPCHLIQSMIVQLSDVVTKVFKLNKLKVFQIQGNKVQ